MKYPTATARECAAAVLEAVPHLMRVLRERVRSASNPDLSIPQFRALAFLGRNSGAMLSDVAAFLALTPPAASKLVEGLHSTGLVERAADSADRRRVALRLTARGRRKFDAAVVAAESYLSEHLDRLDGRTRGEVLRTMETLHLIFEDPGETREPVRPKRLAKT